MRMTFAYEMNFFRTRAWKLLTSQEAEANLEEGERKVVRRGRRRRARKEEGMRGRRRTGAEAPRTTTGTRTA